MIQSRTAWTSARVINSSLITLLLLAFLAQMGIDFSTDNIACACIVLSSSMMTLLYLRWTDALVTHPMSSFAIFGFCVTSQLGALLVQSLSWTALTYELRQPLETFGLLALYQATGISAHAFYRSFTASKTIEQSPVRKLFSAVGLYATPAAANLWVIGGIGVFGILTAGGGGEGGVGNKLSHGLSFLAWAPFLIPVYVQQQGTIYCRKSINYFFLSGYVLLIALLGLAANTRSMMFTGVVTVGLIAVLAGMRSNRIVTRAQVAKIAALLAVGVALIVPMSDLATAMVVSRSARGTSAAQMIERTFEVLQQPHLLEAQRLKEKFASVRGNYDENYIANPIAARFVETKFHDNALYFASQLSPRAEEELMYISIDLLWSTLPDPILKRLGIPVNKSELRFSMGDYLAHQAVGGPLGGYKTGSIFAQGGALFGMFFPLVYFAICLILFALLDLLSFRTSAGKVLVSVIGLLTIWRLFLYGITTESLTNTFAYITRTFIQTIVLYLAAYHLSRLIVKFLPKFNGPRKSLAGASSATP